MNIDDKAGWRFRVKNKRGKWIYPPFFHNGIDRENLNMDTVGLCAGFKIDGRYVYEGDFLYINGVGRKCEVTFENSAFLFGGMFYVDILEDIRMINGNIHDNKI